MFLESVSFGEELHIETTSSSLVDEGILVSPPQSTLADLTDPVINKTTANGIPPTDLVDLIDSHRANDSPPVADLLNFDLASSTCAQISSPPESQTDSKFEFDPLSSDLVSPQRMENQAIPQAESNAAVLIDLEASANTEQATKQEVVESKPEQNGIQFDPFGGQNGENIPPVQKPDLDSKPEVVNDVNGSYLTDMDVLGAPPPTTPPDDAPPQGQTIVQSETVTTTDMDGIIFYCC